MRDSAAAKNLLYRRARALANYENANKNLDKARAKNKDVTLAENQQQAMCETYEKLTETAKTGELSKKPRNQILKHIVRNIYYK